MPTSDDYADWIARNQNKRGTPEFQAFLKAYEEAKTDENRPQEQSWSTALSRGVARVPEQISGAIDFVRNLRPSDVTEGFGSIAPTPLNMLRGQSPLTDVETYKSIARAPIERYGTEERAKETIATDPLGALMDVSLVGRGTGTFLRQVPKSEKLGKVLEKTSEYIDPLTMATNVVTKLPREAAAFRFGAESPEKLREMSTAAFKRASDAGVVIKKEKFNDMLDDINYNLDIDPDVVTTLEPGAAKAFKALELYRDQPITLDRLYKLRRKVTASISRDATDNDMAKILGVRDKIDDLIADLKPADVMAGDPAVAAPAITEARNLWSKMSKGETLDEAVERAKNKTSFFTAAGYENALRTEFRNLANSKQFRRFSKPEQEAILEVVRGGPIDNAMRAMGRFLPTGPVTGIFTGGAYAINPALAATTATMGAAGRAGATAGTMYNVQQASQLMRGGTTLPQKIASFLQNDQRVKKFVKDNPSMAMSIDMMKKAAATGSKVDPYYARQLAAQLARMEEEESK